MRILNTAFAALSALTIYTTVAPPLLAEGAADAVWTGVDIAVLGEVHDNPAHHLEQARLTTLIAPKALVFEMLTEAQVAAAAGADRQDMAALAAALGWAETGWPAFDLYAPIFAAAPDAALYGAGLPHAAARAAMSDGVVASFGAEAAVFGLTNPLPEAQQEARLQLQADAHCGALPEDMLPIMVDLQRLRDAHLARAAVAAFTETGGPVALITGNGHARTDWGATALIRVVQPDLSVVALGQGEEGIPATGVFDVHADAAGVDRGDPCDAFR